MVNSQLNVKTIDELIALSKAKAGTMNYVTASVPLALYMDTLKKEQGADWVRVPFKGGGEAVNAVLSGSTPIALIGEGNVIGQICAGTMTPLVMLNNIRSPNFPNVPTLSETGYKGAPSQSWYGLFMPAGTPRPLVDKVSKEVASIVGDPAFRERHMTARSLVPAVNTPEQFARRDQEGSRDRAAGREGRGPHPAVSGRGDPQGLPRRWWAPSPRRREGRGGGRQRDNCPHPAAVGGRPPPGGGGVRRASATIGTSSVRYLC